MICVSLLETDLSALLDRLDAVSMAEIRLDHLDVDRAAMERIFGRDIPTVATCRPTDTNRQDRQRRLLDAIGAGATYVDVEIESDPAFAEPICEAARSCGCRIIVSHHDYAGTPDGATLRTIVDTCFARGADVAKVACTPRTVQEAARLIGIMDDTRPVLALGMGPLGRITRVAAPLLGAPFTFASFDAQSATAPGQLDQATLQTALALLQSD